MRSGVLLALVLALFPACGGGSESGGVTGDFLTADSRGIGGNVDAAGGGGAASPPAGMEQPGAAAEDGKEVLFREIEEADLYRVEGDLVYLLNAYRGLAVVDLGKMELVGRLALEGFPLEMFLRGGRLFAFLADFATGATLVEISVDDPASPVVRKSSPLSGAYRTSRIVGDVLYALTTEEARSFLLTATPFAAASTVPLPSGAEHAHATDAFLFLASSTVAGGTRITLLDIGDASGAMALRGQIDLPGWLSDDKKLDFGGGVLRVVTHDWISQSLSRLFTIGVSNPDAPVLLATLPLATGEQLFGTEFTEDRAYVVTFEQVDPLWVIDLADPANPRVAGELIVPGWSTQVVAEGHQLVALGIDPALGFRTVVSLFDVSDAAQPALLDREDLGDGFSNAIWDRKGFGVFPGLVLVPLWDGLAVVDRLASSLAVRGTVPVAGGALRGFPHASGIVALGYEELVLADASTLAVTGTVTIAENVVDVGRLADGTLLELVQTGDRVRVKGVELPLWAESMHPYGDSAAVIGWDAGGRAAYVIDFGTAPATVSARLGIGFGGFAVPEDPKMPGAVDPPMMGGGGMDPGTGAGMGRPNFAAGMPMFAPVYFGQESVTTSSGKLVLHGVPSGTSHEFGGSGPVYDGLVVIDIPAKGLGKGVSIHDAAITGFVADGASVAFTFGLYAGADGMHRPLIRHDFVRIDLDSGAATAPVNVPGYVVSAPGADLYTIEETWGDGWEYGCAVVASRIEAGTVTTLDRLALPDGCWDQRAAGSLLFYSTGGGNVLPLFDAIDPTVPWFPTSEIRTVRLGASLSHGPVIPGDDAFRSLLLPEAGSALVLRDGFTVERWSLAGAAAALDWSSDLGGYPARAHADPVNPGRYLLALGYSGSADLP